MLILKNGINPKVTQCRKTVLDLEGLPNHTQVSLHIRFRVV